MDGASVATLRKTFPGTHEWAGTGGGGSGPGIRQAANGALEAEELNGQLLTRKGLAKEFTLTESLVVDTLGTSHTHSSYSY